MSVPPAVRHVSESAFQKAVIQLAETVGWRVAHHHDSRRQVAPGRFIGDRQASGFPDLVMARRGRLWFAELKSEKGRLSSAQREWLDELAMVEAATGGIVTASVLRPSDWDSGEIARVLARRAA